MEAKIAHLTFIQSIIGRMGTNSFSIKGWSVTIVAALFALAAKDTNIYISIIAYIPIFLFWLLDSYFLAQERAYRALYDKVANNNFNGTPFSLSVPKVEASHITSCWKSTTVFPFYLSLAVLTFIAMIILILAR
ncbi:hypothetical protein ABNQ39_06825 [Azospirillum sp. A26]|uniref:hypothetical protein n=1 Tax=Azospirillum sp. A26 TaxID=3160607 RepID=UPI003670E4CF